MAYTVPGYFEQNLVHAWSEGRYLEALQTAPTPPAMEQRRNPH